MHQPVVDMILEIIEMEPDEIGFDDEFRSFEHIDSISALDILTGLERLLRVKVPEKEIRHFTTINGVLSVVERYAPEVAEA